MSEQKEQLPSTGALALRSLRRYYPAEYIKTDSS